MFDLFCFVSCFFFFLFLVFVAFIFCIFLNFGYLSKTSLKKMEIAKNPKMKNAQKKDNLTRAVSTGVFTNRVFFLFCVSLNFAFLLKTL